MKTTCPNCSHLRTNKTDLCLSVNLDKGVAHCHHCDDISWKESEENHKTYNEPPQEWQNHTDLSDGMVKWFKESRGISQDTLIANKVTEEKKWMPQEKKEMNCVVFNYFEGSKLVNKKFRDGKKNFTQISGAKKVFYGINDIIDTDECYIVEGEMDKLAMWEAGYKNTISVPNGAKDLNDIFQTCERFLKNIETFYIAVDMDEPGQELEHNLIKRLGKNKCKRVRFKGKDANDDLLSNSLDESIRKAEPYPIEGTFTAQDIHVDFDKLYNEGLARPIKVGKKDWEEWDEAFAPLRGQLTVVTGIPGSGKSNWLEWYVLNLMDVHGFKTSFYSPEHLPMEVHHAALSEKVIGKPFYNSTHESERMTPFEMNLYTKWSSDKLFLTTPENGLIPDWDWILERFKEQMFRYGIDIFVIDAFNKIKRNNSDSIGEISEILARLTLFAQSHEVLLFLVAHPRKMAKSPDGSGFEIPTLYDIKGSSEFYDQPHNGICVHRYYDENYTKVVPQKIKFKHQGVANKEVNFQYCVSNGRYYPFNGKKDFFSLIEDRTNANVLIGNSSIFD